MVTYGKGQAERLTVVVPQYGEIPNGKVTVKSGAVIVTLAAGDAMSYSE